jgi:hypothetical protein
VVGRDVIVEVEGVEQGCLCRLLTSHHGENLARSMGDQSTTFITPRQGCFSTESAGSSQSALGKCWPVTHLLLWKSKSDFIVIGALKSCADLALANDRCRIRLHFCGRGATSVRRPESDPSTTNVLIAISRFQIL